MALADDIGRYKKRNNIAILQSSRWNEILEATKPFQQQAYEQQSEARLSILPILEPEADADWIRAAEFFLAASAKPSVLLRGPAALERAREEMGSATADIRAAEATLRELCHQARCETPEQLPAAEQRHREWRQLQEQLQGVEAELLHQGGDPVPLLNEIQAEFAAKLEEALAYHDRP